MKRSNLQPAEEFRLNPGQSRVFDGRVIIGLDSQGNLVIGDRKDPKCLEFSYPYGVGGSFRCFAVLVGGVIKVFRGSSIGPGMIDRNQVLATCH